MQTLVAGPRAGLTEARVRAAYQVDTLTVGRGLELVKPISAGGYEVLTDLREDLAGGTIDRDCLATKHGSCKLRIARDLAWGAVRVRPYMTLAGLGPTGVVPPTRWNLGVYLLTSPDTDLGPSVRENVATGYDALWFLDQPIGDSYSLPAGTVVLDAVRAVIAMAPGASTSVQLDGAAASKTLATDMVWVLEENKLVTYLKVVNELLDTVAYRTVWADEEGAYRSEPYRAPATRGIEYAHTVADPRTSLVAPGRTQTYDTFDVPNQWRFVQKGLATRPTQTDGSDGLYVVTNQSDGPTSVDQRGFIKRTVIWLDAVDGAALRSLGDQRVALDRLDVKTLKVKTAPMPGVGHLDVYSYYDPAAGGQLKVQAQKWSLDLRGADMSQTWQVVP